MELFFHGDGSQTEWLKVIFDFVQYTLHIKCASGEDRASPAGAIPFVPEQLKEVRVTLSSTEQGIMVRNILCHSPYPHSYSPIKFHSDYVRNCMQLILVVGMIV